MTWALSYTGMVPVSDDEPTWYRFPPPATVDPEPPEHSPILNDERLSLITLGD